MFMKDAAFLEQLQQELPRRSLSPKATRRFEDTYKMLGVQQEAPVKKRRHKGLWVTATAACLCCGMLFGVNAAFPAFAEGLPGVGRFFEAMNNSFQTAGGSKTPHGANVGTYAVEDVNISDASGQYTVEIQQAFTDGQNASFTLDLTAPTQEWETYDTFTVGTGLGIYVNGSQSNDVFSTSLSRTEEEGHYTGAVTFALPESYQGAPDGTELEVEVTMDMVTYPDKKVYEGYIDVPVDLDASFSLTVDSTSNKCFAANAESNGFQVHQVVSTPTSTEIAVTLPGEYSIDNYPTLLTPDNRVISFSNDESVRNGNYYFEGARDCSLYFDGIPAGTEQLVLRFYKDNKEDSVLAEFTIDLDSEMVNPSNTYEDGGLLDLNDPFHYKYLHGYIAGEPSFENHFAVDSVSYSKEGSSWEVGLLTDEAYKEILVEVYTAGGELIGSTVSEYGTVQGQANWFWDENSPWWNESNAFYPYYAYRVYLDYEESYMPAIDETVTVVVKDNATGEELTRQDVTLDRTTY